jgi:hypothetical protein
LKRNRISTPLSHGCSCPFYGGGLPPVFSAGPGWRPFRRAIERRALWAAEDAARELPNLSVEDPLQLVHLYAERGSPKYEKAAMRWLERYLTEGSPRLQRFAEITASLAKFAE